MSTSSTTYYYDAADRLLGSVVSGDLIPGANPVADGLSPAVGGTPAEVQYDARGNTTKLADQSLVFDLSNQHDSAGDSCLPGFVSGPFAEADPRFGVELSLDPVRSGRRFPSLTGAVTVAPRVQVGALNDQQAPRRLPS